MAMITLVFINQSSVQTQDIQVYTVIKNFYGKKTLSPTKTLIYKLKRISRLITKAGKILRVIKTHYFSGNHLSPLLTL